MTPPDSWREELEKAMKGEGWRTRLGGMIAIMDAIDIALRFAEKAVKAERERCAKNGERHVRAHCRCGKGIGHACGDGASCSCPHHTIADAIRSQDSSESEPPALHGAVRYMENGKMKVAKQTFEPPAGKCPTCDDAGYTMEHGRLCDGEGPMCAMHCPVQVQCPDAFHRPPTEGGE